MASDGCSNAKTSSLKKIMKSVIESIANECDAEMCEAKLIFSNTIREHLVSPVLQKVYKDLFPYVCAVAIVLIIILVFVLLLMFIIITRGLTR